MSVELTKQSARKLIAREDGQPDSTAVATLSLFWLLLDDEPNHHATFFHVDDDVWMGCEIDYEAHAALTRVQVQHRVIVDTECGEYAKLFYKGQLIAETMLGARGGWSMSATTPDGRKFTAAGENTGPLWTGWKEVK